LSPARLFLAGVAALALIAAVGAVGAQTAVSGVAAAGQSLFEDRCASCHAAAGASQGPSLKGVFNRKAGSLPGYNYSAALRGSGLVWNAPTLDRFLTDPAKLVPGTAMAVQIPDPHQRRDLISYLATLK
jgi:cytochrome c